MIMANELNERNWTGMLENRIEANAVKLQFYFLVYCSFCWKMRCLGCTLYQFITRTLLFLFYYGSSMFWELVNISNKCYKAWKFPQEWCKFFRNEVVLSLFPLISPAVTWEGFMLFLLFLIAICLLVLLCNQNLPAAQTWQKEIEPANCLILACIFLIS
jgi:hypothetical protein